MRVEELLLSGFYIPRFQRPYDWGTPQVGDFHTDLRESSKTSVPLFLGLIVLHQTGTDFAVVDGQQRLTTIMLTLSAFGELDRTMRNVGGIKTPWIRPRLADVPFVKALIQTSPPQASPEAPSTLSQWLMKSALEQLRSHLDGLSIDTLLNAEMIVYVAPSLAGATRLFERINLRGKKVSEFDLVKNKLIELAVAEQDATARLRLEEFITARYDNLYSLLDPKADEAAYDSDRLLKVHWIVYSHAPFVSGDRVLNKLEGLLSSAAGTVGGVVAFIQDYLDSLVKVASIWVWIERPYVTQRADYSIGLRNALLDFAKLNRNGELQPLLIASIIRFGSKAEKFVRFCEINSFRAALAKKNSNHGRSIKWNLAKHLHADTLFDAKQKKITSVDQLIHQVFWLATPYWSKAEAVHFDDKFSPEDAASQVIPADALDNPSFLSQYRSIVHYLFWKYGVHLLSSKDWAEKVRVDIVPFQESVWFDKEGKPFRSWDIEHIYPRNAHDRDTKSGAAFTRTMKDWVDHLGNITVLPVHDNRGMGNAVFAEKLAWMLDQAKVSFNKLLADRSYTGNMMNGDYWGPNNCRRRVMNIKISADDIWGLGAMRRFDIMPFDDRIRGFESDEDADESVNGE